MHLSSDRAAGAVIPLPTTAGFHFPLGYTRLERLPMVSIFGATPEAANFRGYLPGDGLLDLQGQCVHLFASAEDLENAMWRAEAAHVEHQKPTGKSHLLYRSNQDETWPAWYASYTVAEQTGSQLPA